MARGLKSLWVVSGLMAVGLGFCVNQTAHALDPIEYVSADSPNIQLSKDVDTTASTANSTQQATPKLLNSWDHAIKTSVPYFTRRPYTVALGTIQSENNFNYQLNTKVHELSGLDNDNFTLPATSLRIGVSPSTEVNFVYLNHDLDHVTFHHYSKTHDGFGDPTIGMRQYFGTIPQVKIRLAGDLSTTIPIGSKFFGLNYPAPLFRLLAEKDIHKLALDLNATGQWLPANRESDYHFYFRPSICGTYQFNPHFALFTEYEAILPSAGVTSHVIQHGLFYRPTPNQQIHLSAGYGFNSLAPSFFVNAGYSFRINQAFQRLFNHG